jgi:hypothetical protein
MKVVKEGIDSLSHPHWYIETHCQPQKQSFEIIMPPTENLVGDALSSIPRPSSYEHLCCCCSSLRQNHVVLQGEALSGSFDSLFSLFSPVDELLFGAVVDEDGDSAERMDDEWPQTRSMAQQDWVEEALVELAERLPAVVSSSSREDGGNPIHALFRDVPSIHQFISAH